MSRLGAEKILAVGAVWLLIMLPSAAFGRVADALNAAPEPVAQRLAASAG